MGIAQILLLVLGAILVNNVIFAQFLGICPYLGVSKKLDTALGMGFAVTFVMTLAVAVTWPIYYFVLNPATSFFNAFMPPDAVPDLTYLATLSFILVIASLVQLVEIVLRKVAKPLFDALGIYLPLITTNCAILGMALLSIQKEYNYPISLVFAFGSALGFILAIVIFAGIRERVELMDVPKAMQGVPIALVIAGIVAMAFMGFAGLGG
ncbi:RnfABCDGE type electron transport complex subunit A [bacterium]|nr:RnfABCDGE type electron transport complex subunit A [bacterium]